MQRVRIAERSQWRARAEESGFRFHTIDGLPYWDESAYYAFTLRQIEQDIEDPSAELHAMAMGLVDEVVGSEQLMDQLAIPPQFRDWIADSWRRREPHLYGRLDFAYDGTARPSSTSSITTPRPRCSRPRSSSGNGWKTNATRTACRRTPTSSTRSTRRWWTVLRSRPRSCHRRCTSARWAARRKTRARWPTCATARPRPACAARRSRSRTSVCPKTAASPRWTTRSSAACSSCTRWKT